MKLRGRVFICYRRDGGADLARLAHDNLRERSFDVSMDMHTKRKLSRLDLLIRQDHHFAFAITSLIFTGCPPCRLLSSAASMKANISIVSSGGTGAMPVWKNFTISRTSGA